MLTIASGSGDGTSVTTRLNDGVFPTTIRGIVGQNVILALPIALLEPGSVGLNGRRMKLFLLLGVISANVCGSGFLWAIGRSPGTGTIRMRHE